MKINYFCKMIKRVLVFLSFSLVLLSCNKAYEKAMKSDDPDFILEAANQLYEDGKWQYAIDLYQKVSSNYAGTEQAESIAWNSAMANYNDKNFPLAARQFKNFYRHFNRNEKADEALYMSAYSYYKGSPEYNLDQKNTYEALKELQGFIDTYPTSPKVKEANQLINELRQKLERKAFEIAKSYYKTLQYHSAAINFANFLDDYPDSSYREEANMYLLRSKALLAINSVFSKKELRLKDAHTAYRLFIKNYPQTEYRKEADRLLSRIEEAQKEHQVALKEIEEFNKNKNKNNS